MREIKFSDLCGFTPKQWEATRTADAHQFTLYGGSRGPGKSYWLRWYLLRLILRLAGTGIKNPIAGLFCEDYPSLTDRQVAKIKQEFPTWLGEVKDSKTEGFGFHIHPQYGGGTLALRNLDDPSKYQSAEFCGIGVDELTKDPLDTFNLLRGSLRWKGVDSPRFVAATNPGGIGHVWVRGMWIERRFPVEMNAIKDQFAFVAALPDDNPHLSSNYWSMLDSLPDRLRRAWRHGDWNAFEGQFFTEFQESELIDPHLIDDAWKFTLAIDPGWGGICAATLCAYDFDGNVELISTYYEHARTPDQNATGIKQWIKDNPWTAGRWPDVRVAGLDAWHHKDRHAILASERTFNDEFSDTGIYLERAATDRHHGWAALRSLMPDQFKIFNVGNQHLLDEMSTVCADENDPDDIEGKGNDVNVADHALDSLRYNVMATGVPRKVKLKPAATWQSRLQEQHSPVTTWEPGD